MTREQSEQRKTLEQSLANLPGDVRALIDENNLTYYKRTNTMHTDWQQPGGSKFRTLAEGGVDNIFELLEKHGVEIAKRIKDRQDDRESLLATGAPESAFLPATKTLGMPDLPEALYYKIDNVKGKLSIIALKNLDPETKIIIRREKSIIDEKTGKEKVPCSFTAIQGTMENLPNTNFATVIFGRVGGEKGKNQLWTIHPGAPIRATDGDFIPGAETLPGPDEEGKQQVMVMTVRDLLASKKITADDFIKIAPGDFDKEIKKYQAI